MRDKCAEDASEIERVDNGGGKYCVLEHAVDNGCTIPDA
jgi:hypothetical protein